MLVALINVEENMYVANKKENIYKSNKLCFLINCIFSSFNVFSKNYNLRNIAQYTDE